MRAPDPAWRYGDYSPVGDELWKRFRDGEAGRSYRKLRPSYRPKRRRLPPPNSIGARNGAKIIRFSAGFCASGELERRPNPPRVCGRGRARVVYIFYPFLHLSCSDGERVEQVTETLVFCTLFENGAKSLAGGDLERTGFSRGPRLASMGPRRLARAPSMVVRNMRAEMGGGWSKVPNLSAPHTAVPPIRRFYFRAVGFSGPCGNGGARERAYGAFGRARPRANVAGAACHPVGRSS